MTLIKSISGFRGTIGGHPNENLTPLDLVGIAAAFGQFLHQSGQPTKIVIGRDGRMSGYSISQLVVHTLIMQGIDVVDLGLSTTPTVEIAVPMENAGGGIVVSASHNAKHWNALKLLNENGEFISKEDSDKIKLILKNHHYKFAKIDKLGQYSQDDHYIDKHIDLILKLEIIDVEQIKSAKFNVVVDCINSTGALAVPKLLNKLGIRYHLMNEEITGNFAHDPEPLAKNLTDLSLEVIRQKADLGISVDPDVDRLAFVCDDGAIFGEEYTLVAAADYVLQKKQGPSVSNLSSTIALNDISQKHGCQYFTSAVGEINVIEKMKIVNAVIGGEGNGGVILPDLHYGRDALVGIALVISLLAQKDCSLSELRKEYPKYEMVKQKINLKVGLEIETIYNRIRSAFKNEKINMEDGLRVDFKEGWVHLRPSNTEPVIRIYSEASTSKKAHELSELLLSKIN